LLLFDSSFLFYYLYDFISVFLYFVCRRARYSLGGAVSEIWRVAQLKAKAQLKANMYHQRLHDDKRGNAAAF
jgi:hypothetical protein